MILFDHVTKKYGNGTVAMSDVSFRVDPGEFVIIEGPSGAGKTSLMRAMIKDITITSGAIEIDGIDTTKMKKHDIPELRRKIGVVFQDFKLLMDRTVAENIDLALDILGLEGEAAIKRRNELLELTGLSGKENDFPVQLSGGEMQRVAIARALAPQPKILFADEPTGNLDGKTAMAIIELLHDINSQGTTVLMATHDLELVKNYKLRRLEFRGGTLVKDVGKKEPKEHKEKTEGESHES